MPDVALVNRNAITAPKDYVVPGAQEFILKAVIANIDGTASTGSWQPALQVLSPAGDVMFTAVLPTVAAAGSANVSWFPGAELEDETASAGAGVIVEQGFVVASAGVPKVFTTNLQSGRTYIVTAQGTYTNQNAALTSGTPNANAMFPTSEPGRISTQVGTDPDVTFAAVAGQPLGHTQAFRFSLDGGATFAHMEPVGGPFSTPQTNYFYTYNFVGQGHPLQAQIFDSVYTDNYGELLVTIQTTGGSSGGGGGGSLLPDPSQQPDGAWLRTSSGTAVWKATPQVAETDLNFTDVTTGNVSTTKHGLTPKLPNNAAQFLDGTGAFSTPAGTSPLTTKGDVYGFSTVNARIPIGTDAQVLTADSTQTLGLKWAAASPLTTKGDVYTFGTANTRLGVGSDSQVLLADSTQATGLRWGAVPAGSGGAMTQICQSILGGAQATFDTNTILGGNIPGTYNHLRIILYARFSDAANNEFAALRFNNDSAANYDWVGAVANATPTVAAEGNVAQTSIVTVRFPGANATANRFGLATIEIPMYAGTTGDKSCTSLGHAAQTTLVGGINWESTGGTWRSTAAITRITVIDQGGGNFAAGSAFMLYGIT